jgi:excisionase family DNA binding protein
MEAIMQLYFSASQVANELGISPDHVRKLAQAGAVKAETTPGGQLRVAAEELDRLKRDGLPPMPRPLPGDRRRPVGATAVAPPPGLYAPPSPELVAAAEQSVLLTHELKTLRLTRRKENELDHYRKREARLQQEQADREAVEQARQADLDAQVERQDWLRCWELYALDAVPQYAGPEVRLEIHGEVRERLAALDPLPSDDTCRELVTSIVAAGLRRVAARRESKRAVESALRALPTTIRYGSGYAADLHEALTTMTAAVDALPLDTDFKVKVAAASRSVATLVHRHSHRLACEKLLDGLERLLPGANGDELTMARRTLAVALEPVPVDAPAELLQSVRDRMLPELRDRITQRIAAEHRQRQDAQRRARAESRVATAMGHVDQTLRVMESKGELEFSGLVDRWTTSNRVKESVRAALMQELSGLSSRLLDCLAQSHSQTQRRLTICGQAHPH